MSFQILTSSTFPKVLDLYDDFLYYTNTMFLFHLQISGLFYAIMHFPPTILFVFPSGFPLISLSFVDDKIFSKVIEQISLDF